MGIEPEVVIPLDRMAMTDELCVSVTGITKGDLVDGVRINGNLAHTETLLIRGHSRTIRRIDSTHFLNRRSPELQQLVL